MNPVLEIRNLSIGYRNGVGLTNVLDGVNLTLYEGELVSLLGANGTGKSTLLRTVAGLQPPLGGDVLVKGVALQKYANKQLSRLISIVSTERVNAGGLTVRELVSLGRQPYTGFLGRLGSWDKEIVEDSMDAVGISHKAERFVAELSDGERQKVMISKALAQESPIIILDEPTAFLDAANRVEILQLLHNLSRNKNKSVLLSSHDISQSLALSDRLWLMCGGVVDAITPEDAVLQGRMSGLFNSGKVEFDTFSGEFVYQQDNNGADVSVCGTDMLRHWCSNALRRNGFNVVNDSAICVRIKSPSDIESMVAGEHICFKFVSELTEYLIDANNKGRLWK